MNINSSVDSEAYSKTDQLNRDLLLRNMLLSIKYKLLKIVAYFAYLPFYSSHTLTVEFLLQKKLNMGWT